MHSRITVICATLAVFSTCSVDQTFGAPQKDAAAAAPVAAPAAAASPAQYTTKYDNIDVDQILSSKRLVVNYVQCLLDKKPCSPEGAELRKVLPDALQTQCSKCNPTQKNVSLRVVDRLQKDYKNEWKMLLDKWDPKREYLAKFQEFLAEEKKKGEIKF